MYIWEWSLKQGTMLDCSHLLLLLQSHINFKKKIVHFLKYPVELQLWQLKNSRMVWKTEDIVPFSRSGCTQLSHSNLLTSNWNLLIYAADEANIWYFKRFLSTAVACQYAEGIGYIFMTFHLELDTDSLKISHSLLGHLDSNLDDCSCPACTAHVVRSLVSQFGENSPLL